jgi:gamma-glutamylcyclotransferase (GGCT)/AIG2-like uncharacterized protein YtfP
MSSVRPNGIHIFVYGTLRRQGTAADLLDRCQRLRDAAVQGTLYDVDATYPALVLAGNGRVHGEIWRCPHEILPRLDAYEGVRDRLFRRVGVLVDELPCWTYVAGPALARRLTPDRRIPEGTWPPAGPTG